jgi:hypothetical protein
VSERTPDYFLIPGNSAPETGTTDGNFSVSTSLIRTAFETTRGLGGFSLATLKVSRRINPDRRDLSAIA